MIVSRRILDRLFPAQRELILRARGRVRYVRLNRYVQFGAVALTLSALAWTVVSTIQFAYHHSIVSERDAGIDQLRAENDRVARELAKALSHGETQKRFLNSTQQATTDRERKLVAALTSRRDLSAELALAQEALGELRSDILSIEKARAQLKAQLLATDERLREAVNARVAANIQREALGDQVADLSARLVALETGQAGIVSRIGKTANESGAALRKTMERAGLDVDRLLDRMARAAGTTRGVGGPFLAMENSLGAELATQIAAVERRIDELQNLQLLMGKLPLVAPLDEYRVTSNFGRRIDPFTKNLAFHSGTDMASRRRAPVRVTSPGEVTFVGWKGGFGKMVEVDHGLGVRTRYGHLSSIFVRRGQELDFFEKVGFLGNTGRSSGEHLHYEILIDGQPSDPLNFIKAGQYVFKN